ncbi:MAG: endopeptidase La [Bacteroidota bacterium]
MFEDFFFPQDMSEDSEFLPLFSIDDQDGEELEIEDSLTLPVLALKNTVLFPGVVIPITIGRAKSIKAVNKAHDSHRMIAVLSQRSTKTEDPNREDLFGIGTVAKLVKLLRMPDGTVTAILQGRHRFQLEEMTAEEPYLEGRVNTQEEVPPEDQLEFKALIATLRDKAKEVVELSPNIPSEAVMMLGNITDDSFLLNFIASNMGLKIEVKQHILELDQLTVKATTVLENLDAELQLLELKNKIESKVRGDLEKQQRDYFLGQQLKTIQEELGQNPQTEEIEALVVRAKQKSWPEEVKKSFEKDINKLRRTNPQMAEYSVLINYLELLLDLPWREYTEDNFDLQSVQQVLDQDHFGLEDVKERILEHLAVLKLKGDMKAPILCLVGPPGVGKTSLGRSIANALQRKFIRMSLGGLHDESEIRGHRKTYIGAMPGRIIQSLKKAASSNPVFILDEIDKVGKDFRGDPSSALLEVLDPEQNETFHDNYLELEYDLSKVLFIATANSLSTIQPALLDRMEIIQISGYSTEEKVEIAKRHLVPNQRKEHGLKAKEVQLSKEVTQQIIQQYTRESGVRNLNRQIASVMRSVAKKVAMEEPYSVKIKKSDLKDMLGPSRFNRDRYREQHGTGVAVGLAWTSVGGDILFIESSLSAGKGKLTLTGNLGDVMKESATTALSYLKAHSERLGLDTTAFGERDIHIHVPEGAIPKDGPSAGITMLTALASAFGGKAVKPFLAMTGEITLRGKVLPVGGIKEKILAAKRAGIRELILCKENQKHVDEIKEEYRSGLQFHYVDQMEEVLAIALELTPVS